MSQPPYRAGLMVAAAALTLAGAARLHAQPASEPAAPVASQPAPAAPPLTFQELLDRLADPDLYRLPPPAEPASLLDLLETRHQAAAQPGSAAENDPAARQREARYRQNLAESQAFLQENARRPEVVVLDSGLQYEVLASGPAEGKSPFPADIVTLHYRVTLPDGTLFMDTTTGEPDTHPLGNRLIGWMEVVVRMRPGDRWRVYLPPDLAATSSWPSQVTLEPGQALVAELELVAWQVNPARALAEGMVPGAAGGLQRGRTILLLAAGGLLLAAAGGALTRRLRARREG